ncbi:MAG: class I SAM-dependent DNA methyltransferase [Methylococcales bacterium]|nr:class I SAM-dependent DNA methyltransferase [Methylococcales bacterium]
MSARNTVKSIQQIMWKDAGVDGDAQRLSQLCWMFFLKIIDDQDQQLEMMLDNYRSPIPEALQWRTWAADPEGITGDTLLTFINTELFPKLKELPTTGKNTNRSRMVRSVFEDAYNYMKSGQLLRQVINKISGVDFNDLSERKHFGDIYEQLLNDLQAAGNAGEFYTPRAITAFMVDRIDPKPGEILLDTSCGTGGFLTCAIRHMRDRYVKKVEDEQAMQASLRAVEKKQLPHMLCVTNMLLHGIEDPSFVLHDNTLARPYISYGQADRVDIILTNSPFGGKEEDGIESNFPAHFRTRETADLFLALFIRLLKPGGRAAIVLPDGSLFGEGVKTRLKEHLLKECNLHTIVRLPNSVFKPYASIGTNLLFFEKGEPTQDIWYYEHRVPEGQKAYSMTRPIKVEHLQGCVDWWGGAERQNRQQTEVAWKVSLDEIKARNYNLDFKNPHTVADDHGDPQELLVKLEQDEQKTANLRDQLKTILAEALQR